MVDVDSITKKWGFEILNSLKEGAKRFNQLMKLKNNTNKKISSRTLAIRLKDLEKQKLIIREVIDERPPTSLYKLTEKGKKVMELVVKLHEL